jgi:hypothetical protein
MEAEHIDTKRLADGPRTATGGSERRDDEMNKWLAAYATGWVVWMAGFAMLAAGNVTRPGDIWWALLGATLWPVLLPVFLFLLFFP